MAENKQITRKDFLKGVGVTVAGVAVTGSLTGILTGCSTPAPAAAPAVDTSQAPAWPFKYEKMDVAVAQENAYKGYKEKGGWGAGVAEGFFGTLSQQVGYPFNQYPAEVFSNFAAGFTQAQLCGTLGTAAACLGTVCDPDTARKILGELENWYKDAELPIYQPAKLDLATTVAGSLTCGDSVSTWMTETGFAMGDAERKERCAGVAADVTGKMVELLNATLV